ncbi:MAG TPA: CheR family methyltransferase [Rhodopila sp.]|nr:CheR family methyltransferase [Rhodopila sp.]
MSTTVVFPFPKTQDAPSTAITPADFMVIADLLRARSGIVLGQDKAYLVESRLDPIVRTKRYAGIADIAARLRTSPHGPLANDIIEALTTNETLFFRDGKPFEHLRRRLPSLHAAGSATQPLRIWSAAASSGQESYSIAMTALDASLGPRPVHILGTDISAAQIDRARQGVYSEFEVQRGLTAEHLARHFSKTDKGWRINDTVRKLVEFRRWNLMDDLRPLGSFDLVFCRNVLIYFDIQTKRKVLDAIWERLVPGGLLYLGGSETTFGVSDRFAPCRGVHQVYAAVKS